MALSRREPLSELAQLHYNCQISGYYFASRKFGCVEHIDAYDAFMQAIPDYDAQQLRDFQEMSTVLGLPRPIGLYPGLILEKYKNINPSPERWAHPAVQPSNRHYVNLITSEETCHQFYEGLFQKARDICNLYNQRVANGGSKTFENPYTDEAKADLQRLRLHRQCMSSSWTRFPKSDPSWPLSIEANREEFHNDWVQNLSLDVYQEVAMPGSSQASSIENLSAEEHLSATPPTPTPTMSPPADESITPSFQDFQHNYLNAPHKHHSLPSPMETTELLCVPFFGPIKFENNHFCSHDLPLLPPDLIEVITTVLSLKRRTLNLEDESIR